MKRKQLWMGSLIGGVIILLIIYQMFQSTPAQGLRVMPGNIQQYVDDTGTVKAVQSQTVYLENAGRISSIFVSDGDHVRQGDLLLKMSPADLKLVEVTSEQARISYDSARKDWEKAQNLFQTGAISKTEYDNAEAAYKQATASLQSANLELEKQRKNLIVQAPISGLVLQKSVDLNQVVTPGTVAFIIGDANNLKIEVDILADDVVKIRPGNSVEITGQATGGSVLRGKVIKVAPMAQNIVSSLGVNQKRATVTIAFTGDQGLLKPGYDVDVRIFTMSKTGIITVPASAVFDLQGKNYILAVVKNRTQLRQVEKGIENDEKIEIRSGLKVGDWILIKPDNDIKAGMKVKVVKKAL